ncbi:MAG: hypothetical protein ACYST9_00320 [Planctomycetota bacterium]
MKKELPLDQTLENSYHLTKLEQSTSADVLSLIHQPEYELLSQSRSVVASVGQKKNGHEIWLNMVAFDENELLARRKYFFMVDEKVSNLLLEPGRKLRFSTEMVLDAELVDKPYADENARRMVILEKVLQYLRWDIDSVSPNNKKVGICGMLINQTLAAVLQKLTDSPVLTSKLNTTDGLEFDHITLGKGTITMALADNIVDVKIKLGAK